MCRIKSLIQLTFPILLVCSFADFTLSQNVVTDASLIARYDTGNSLFRVIEDLQILDDRNKAYSDPQIAIRICSSEPLSRSFASASVSPQQIVEYLSSNAGYDTSSIFIVRSSRCTAVTTGPLFATEIWAFDKGSKLPANDEFYSYANIEFGSFGFDPVDCPRASAAKNRQKFNAEMKVPGTYGAIIGYYLKKPLNVLKTNIEKADRLLVQDKIPKSRYFVEYQPWHDGDSGCSSVETTRPMLLTIRIKSNRR